MSADPGHGELDPDTERILLRFGEIYAMASGGRLSPAEYAAVLLRSVLIRLGADAAFVATLADAHTIEAIQVTPASPNFVRLAFPTTSPYPLAATLRHGRSLYIGSNLRLACDHPGLVRIKPEDHSCATVPLTGPGGRVLGAINLTFEKPHEFTAEDRAVVEELAAECSSILADAFVLSPNELLHRSLAQTRSRDPEPPAQSAVGFRGRSGLVALARRRLSAFRSAP